MAHDISDQISTVDAIRQTRTEFVSEQAALRKMDVALREVLDKIKDEKILIKSRIKANINGIILSLIENLKARLDDGSEKKYVQLLERSLLDVASPLIKGFENRCEKFSLSEIEIYSMIKKGLSCKAIAGYVIFLFKLLLNSVRKYVRNLESIIKKLISALI